MHRSKRRNCYASLFGLFLLLSSFIAAGCLHEQHKTRHAADGAYIDSINTLANYYRYRNPDSSLYYAQKAEILSEHFPAKYCEALNYQLFHCFLQIDFEGGLELYQRIQQSTYNQIELLFSEVYMMMLCQRVAQNRLFFDYHNRALEKIEHIKAELDDLNERNKKRFIYAETEFHLISALAYIYLMQNDKAAAEFATIDKNGPIRRNNSLLAHYHYLRGISRQRDIYSTNNWIVQTFDDLLIGYSLAERWGITYYEAQTEQAMAELLLVPNAYEILKSTRHADINYLYNLFSVQDSTAHGLNLAESMARKGVVNAKEYNNLLLIANGNKALGSVMFAQKKYEKALTYFEKSLSYLNIHHQTFYPDDKIGLLKTFDTESELSTDMRWITDDNVLTAASWLALLRERLSATYSALDDKVKSDYNRNIYFDLLDYTRQDKSLESRIMTMEQDNNKLNILLGVVILLTLFFAIFVFIYSHRWKKRNHIQYALLDDLSNWFMKVAFTDTPYNLDQILNQYSWLKNDRKMLREVMQPYVEWIEKNKIVSDEIEEEQAILHEKLLESQRNISKNKKRNISKRAKVSLVHSITPFIDRILYTTKKMERTGVTSPQDLEYINELSDKINIYNEVLSEWIQIHRGEIEMTIESFPLQHLFDLLQKGNYNFQKKNLTFIVKPTTLWIKANKALTFFMINTLVDNARKFTPEGGTITVDACETEQESVEIAVTDTGCGLSEDDIHLILSSKIYDADKIGAHSPYSRKHKGSGFGLLNCKGIIEKYKKYGELFSVCRFHIKSKPGKGSQFLFRLPKGIQRTLIWIGLSVFCSMPVQAETNNAPTVEEYRPDTQSFFKKSNLYADSVYFLNIAGNYKHSMECADSALKYINLYYRDVLPENCKNKELKIIDTGIGSLEWIDLGVKADYFMIMSLRNEIAIAALALHQWEIYNYNNNQFTHLYKTISKDTSLEKFYSNQRNIHENLTISVVILLLSLIGTVILIYTIHFRRRILFRFDMMQVLETNQAMLQIVGRFARSNHTDELLSQLLPVMFSSLEELHEITFIRIRIYKENGSKIGNFSYGNLSYEDQTDAMQDKAYEKKDVLYDPVMNTKVYPLTLKLNPETQVCIGVVALNYGTYKMQKEDFILESYIINYFSILLYESVIRREYDWDNIELAEDEKQRAMYEESRIRVQNQILDNCLSTIKHESIYYPSRIKQIIKNISENSNPQTIKEQIRSLSELTEYYKEIYTLLCAQADRQLDTGLFKGKCGKITNIVERWENYAHHLIRKRGCNIRLEHNVPTTISPALSDEVLTDFMLETISNEWIDKIAKLKIAATVSLSVVEENRFIRFTLSTPAPVFTTTDAQELFFPSLEHYHYLLCKEIIREYDKLKDFCGCRINAHTDSQGYCHIWFTIPKFE